MGRKPSQQSTFTKGELDPDLSERGDLEHYYDSLASALNCVFHPQGGFSDRGGFQLCSDSDVLNSGVKRRLRRRIAAIPVTAAMITATNGGVAGNLVDQNLSTIFQTNAVTSAVFELVQIDLGTARRVDAIDLQNFYSELLGADEAIAVQYYNGAAWVTFGDAPGLPTAKGIRTVASGGQRYRRFSVSPGGPGGNPVVARQWRVVALDSVGIGRVQIGGMMMWAETGQLSPIREMTLSRDAATVYQMVMTERNIDVFAGGRYCASISTPYAAQQISELTSTGGIDRLVLFHEMTQPFTIIRQGTVTEWQWASVNFTGVPNATSGALFSGSQDEIQRLDLSGLVAGDAFGVFLGSQYAGEITFTTAAALPGQLLAALGSVPGLTAGSANIITSVSGQVVRIRFGGANGNRTWPLVSAIPVNKDVQPTTAIEQAGMVVPGAYFAAETGWPRAGDFIQSRLMVGGFRGAPTSYRFSRVSTNNNWNDFTSTGTPLTADLGFGGTLEADDADVIFDIYEGRHLQIFSQVGEWWATATVLSATAPISFSRATAQGKQRGVPMIFHDGASLFLQVGGNTLREFLYVEAEASYSADPLSVLCPHLMKSVRDCAMRPGRDVSHGDLLLFANADGTAAAITTLRKQQVIAGAPWVTLGKFLSVSCGLDFQVWVIVERFGDRYLERWMPDMPLDFATRLIAGAPTSAVTGAEHLEGRSDVWAIADGEIVGPLTVAGGGFVLPAAATDITYGLMPAWKVAGQEVKNKLQKGEGFRLPGRIYEVELSLKATGGITLGTNGAPHVEVPLTFTGDAMADAGPYSAGGEPQLPVFQRLFTGNVTMQGLLGVSKTPYFELGRVSPSPVHVKGVRYELSDKGD